MLNERSNFRLLPALQCEREEKYLLSPSKMFSIIRKTWKGINQTKMEGGGQSDTYQRLTISVIRSAGERREDVEMK